MQGYKTIQQRNAERDYSPVRSLIMGIIEGTASSMAQAVTFGVIGAIMAVIGLAVI